MEKVLDLKDLMSACSKVLLVEESLSERKRLVRWLQRHGKTELKGVGSGEALVMLRDEDIDLLVLGRSETLR